MRQNRRSKAGFTLVELLIGAALSATVMAAVLSSYIYLGRSLARLANQQILETEARRTTGYFTRDVRTATGIVTTATLNAARVSLEVSATNSTQVITYYYNNGSNTTNPVSINGTNITMPANTLTRCIYDGSTTTSTILLRNIISLTFHYYDAAGTEYTTFSDYLPGLKQLAVQFSTKITTVNNGTTTPVQNISTGRLVMRNKALPQ